MQYFHFIAIGGAVMHQLASHLRNQGNRVSGSDDAIFEPAKSNLEKLGLMPEQIGWFPEKITTNIDAIILGMHAKSDNPELIKAQELGLKIYSFPEFIFEQCKDKTRIAIAGSHGKTSITSMIMHLLRTNQKAFDYLVGAKLDGFDFMVKTSNDAPLMVIEADEYLTSPLDLRSKFLHYHPHIAIISGIAWDHINVFPTFEAYLETFRKFILSIQPDGYLIYNSDDEELVKMINQYPITIFGSHNFANLKAAFEVGKLVGIAEDDILINFQSFQGAAKRLEKIKEDKAIQQTIFRDFAHAPSKVSATVKAVRERYKSRKIIAVFELHTYSSLQENFIEQYQHSLDAADVKILFLDEEALKIKNKQDLDEQWLKAQFADDSIFVFKNANTLKEKIEKELSGNCVLLLMSSGNFGGISFI